MEVRQEAYLVVVYPAVPQEACLVADNPVVEAKQAGYNRNTHFVGCNYVIAPYKIIFLRVL